MMERNKNRLPINIEIKGNEMKEKLKRNLLLPASLHVVSIVQPLFRPPLVNSC
jgi:hypothetical protein